MALLADVSTKPQVQDLLKERGCTHSGTWADILGARIPLAIENGALEESDLVSLIDSAEENGAQHVFLYSCSKKFAKSIISNTQVIKKNLKKYDVESALNRNTLSPTPKHLELVAVRYEKVDGEKTLVFKFLETRFSKERFSVEVESDKDGTIEVQKYRIEEHRATSTLRIRDSGFLEIRIGSAGKSGLIYASELERLVNEAQNYIDLNSFNLFSLSNFKSEIGDYPEDYASDLRLKTVTVRNDEDQVLIGKSGLDSGGIGSDGLSALSQFRHSGGHHDHSSVVFLVGDGDDETEHAEVSANFRGQPHEFSLTKQVSGEHYERILRFIRKTTRNFSERN